MIILLNERPYELPSGATLADVRQQTMPSADVLIVNGAVAEPSYELHEGDQVVLITRGEQPTLEELDALMAARHTPGVHAVMKRSCVGIAGLGGLGSTVAVALARMGVGRLILVDCDVVEPSNLNRQQYFIDQIGQPKAVALAATLARVNPCVQYEPHVTKITPDNVAVLFGGVHVLIEAFDRADQKAMLAAQWQRLCPDVPLVMASGVAGVGPATTITARQCGRALYVVGDFESGAQPGRGLMAPRVGIAAHLQATLAVRLLLGDTSAPL